MKNTTTALILTTMCMIGNFFSDSPHMFISASIFASTYLILAQLEENNKSKNDNTDA